jgi:hypothetical protein
MIVATFRKRQEAARPVDLIWSRSAGAEAIRGNETGVEGNETGIRVVSAANWADFSVEEPQYRELEAPVGGNEAATRGK